MILDYVETKVMMESLESLSFIHGEIHSTLNYNRFSYNRVNKSLDYNFFDKLIKLIDANNQIP